MCQGEFVQLHWTCEKCGRNTKKWTTYKSKKKDSKTSEAFEETVIGIIWDATIDGIPGGLDLAEKPEEPPAHEVESAGPSHITDFQSPCLG